MRSTSFVKSIRIHCIHFPSEHCVGRCMRSMAVKSIITMSFIVFTRVTYTMALQLMSSFYRNQVYRLSRSNQWMAIISSLNLLNNNGLHFGIIVLFQGQLRLGVQSGGTVHLSDYFDIRPSQEAREPGMDCTGMAMLPSGGYLTVTFWQKRDDQFLVRQFLYHQSILLNERALITFDHRDVGQYTLSESDTLLQ